MFRKRCVCGVEYDTADIRQSKCRKDCGRTTPNRARAGKNARHEVRFIGVDGEGVTRPDGQHDYVMLSVGDRTLFNDGNQLTLESILEFLWSSFLTDQDGIYVGFFLGYDFVQWQKLLPEDTASLLLTTTGVESRKVKRRTGDPTPDPVVWQGWEMDMLAGRRFKLRPHVHKPSQYGDTCRNKTCGATLGDIALVLADSEAPRYIPPGEMEWTPDASTVGEWLSRVTWSKFCPKGDRVASGDLRRPWLYICDTGAFWQESFVGVINPRKWDRPVCTPEEYRTIIEGKAKRDTIAEYGDTSYYSDMVRYNILENAILSRVTTRLNEGFMNEHIPIRIPKADWYGPGRAAQIWIDNLSALVADPDAVAENKGLLRSGVRGERRNEYGLANVDVYASMPEYAYEAARSTYYGGWFEIFMHGHVGDAWEYDINSAYPAIIATLPCLHTEGDHNGHYYQGSGNPIYLPGDYVMVYATVTGSDPYIGAMPLRTKTGAICRPHNVKGWYWQHEINAAIDAGLIDSVEVEEYVGYTPCLCTPPFNPASIGIERMYQLRLDVGKNTPQGKGFKLVYNSAYGKTAQSIGNPKYANPFYASLITAGCRTMILRAIATHPRKSRAVAMVATDGVYFTSPHPSLELSPSELGKWDVTEKASLTLLMPGVYWDDKARQAITGGENPKLKSRGINAADLAGQIQTLDRLFLLQEMRLRETSQYEWPTITFNVRFLMDTAKLALQRGKWNTAGKVHRNATRVIDTTPDSKRETNPYWDAADSVVRTRPYSMSEVLETFPYQLMFGMRSEDEQSLFPGQIDLDGMAGWNWQEMVNL